MLQRCYAVEPLVAVACSLDGVYCAGGGQSGTIYVWEAPSGRLLQSWPAHYKVNSDHPERWLSLLEKLSVALSTTQRKCFE